MVEPIEEGEETGTAAYPFLSKTGHWYRHFEGEKKDENCS